jgi:large subunit ribosomal protein L24
MKLKIKKGDTVEVINGRSGDKGQRGEVIKVLPDENRVVVQGVNQMTKHQRQVQSQGRTLSPGRVRREFPVHVANVMLVCPKCSKATRVGLQREGDKSLRTCKKCQSVIDE